MTSFHYASHQRSLLLVALLAFLVQPLHGVYSFHISPVRCPSQVWKVGSVGPLYRSRSAPLADQHKSQHKTCLSAATSIAPGGSQDDQTSTLTKFKKFADNNFFLLGMVVAVTMAKIMPSLGKNGSILRPELFVGQFGIMFIFLLAGISLELSELKDALADVKLNVAIQMAIFLAWPFLIALPITTALRKFAPGLLPPTLLDGILVMSCLPTTVNMCILLTSASGGNIASSLCNAVISNLSGIFVTPALLLRFFGASIQLPFGEMIVKLCKKVLLPVTIGQLLRQTKAKDIYIGNKKRFKRIQEMVLLSIVWNAFCNAFSRGLGLDLRHGFTLLMLLPAMHLMFVLVLRKLFAGWNGRKEVVAAMFTGSQKTLAFGLPLVNTIFEGNPNLAAYCAPIMFIHPMQLVLGSLLVPKLSKYIEDEENEESTS